jgi:hypothetical protein
VIRRRIDATGARPFFLLALGLHTALGVYWWCFLGYGIGGIAGVAAAYFFLGLAVATWTIANLNYLPKILSAEERTLAVAIHGAVTSFLGGLSPILWGVFLKSGEGAARGIDIGVFQWFFVSVAAGGLVLFTLIGRVSEPQGQSVEPLMIGNAILRPFRAMTYLVNLVEPRSSGKGSPREP